MKILLLLAVITMWLALLLPLMHEDRVMSDEIKNSFLTGFWLSTVVGVLSAIFIIGYV